MGQQYLYQVKSFMECFNEDVRYIIEPNEGSLRCSANYYSVHIRGGVTYQSEGKIWINNNDPFAPEFETSNEDQAVECRLADKNLNHFLAKARGARNINKYELALLLLGQYI